MFRRVRFECEACSAGFVDWHDDAWQRTPVFCVHCGKPIAAWSPADEEEEEETPTPLSRRESESALGVLRTSGDGFPDTLRGLKPPSNDTSLSAAVRAASTAPRLASDVTPLVLPDAFRSRRRRLIGPLAALVLGFAAGVPLTLVAEEPILRVLRPAAQAELARARGLGLVSTALDDGELERARRALDWCAKDAPTGDKRVATLRARLALALILANRPEDARREMASVREQPHGHPTTTDLDRVYDALLGAKQSAVAANAAPAPAASAAPAVPKPPQVVANAPVSRQTLLSRARDQQRASKLDEAERLYRAVLEQRPSDSEARCGLAEVQLLRGSADDAAAMFERALRTNENYVPAWVGLADIDWLRGHPERAACRYQLVVDRFPEGSYPPYITQRIARVLGSGASLPTARGDVRAADSCH